MTAVTRINARLPPEVARKLVYLARRTKLSTTQILLASIERYYDAVVRETDSPAQVLSRAGFVGCADGPGDLSSTYKAELARGLGGKV